MATHEVTFPVTDPAEILKLRAGDEVVVQGHIIGIRDRTQIRIFDEGVDPPCVEREDGSWLVSGAANADILSDLAAALAGVHGIGAGETVPIGVKDLHRVVQDVAREHPALAAQSPGAGRAIDTDRHHGGCDGGDSTPADLSYFVEQQV